MEVFQAQNGNDVADAKGQEHRFEYRTRNEENLNTALSATATSVEQKRVKG